MTSYRSYAGAPSVYSIWRTTLQGPYPDGFRPWYVNAWTEMDSEWFSTWREAIDHALSEGVQRRSRLDYDDED